MEEIKIKISNEIKNSPYVSTNIEGEYLVLRYEVKKDFKFGDYIIWKKYKNKYIKGIIICKCIEHNKYFQIFDPFSKKYKFLNDFCYVDDIKYANKQQKQKIIDKINEEGYIIDFNNEKIIYERK